MPSLPVSSSGHIAFFQGVFGINDADIALFFTIILHLGTLVAVCANHFGYKQERRGYQKEYSKENPHVFAEKHIVKRQTISGSVVIWF